MTASRGAHANECSRDLLLQCPTPAPMSHSLPLLSQETPQELQVGLTQILMASLLRPGTQCTWKPVCALQAWGVCVPSPLELLCTCPAGVQCHMLWGAPTSGASPQAGDPDVGFGTLAPVGEPLRPGSFPVCGSLTWRIRMAHTMKAPLVPSQHGCCFVCGCRLSRLVVSSLFY